MLKKDSHINKWSWETWIATHRRKKLDPCLQPAKSQIIKVQRHRNQTRQLSPGRRKQSTFFLVEAGTNFLNKNSTIQEIKTRNNRWNGITLKSFCTAKEMIKNVNRAQETE